MVCFYRRACLLLAALFSLFSRPVLAGEAGGSAPPPAVVYIWYADGGRPPAESACAGKIPPPYTCSFGRTTQECKQQVQQYLDRWYADMNVVFTYNRPTAGAFFTVVVASEGGAWCNQNYDARVGGVAPISCDHVLGNGTCYAFQCGRDAKTCATIIAQEQAHLVGLEHTGSPNDAMYVYVSAVSDGFEDAENMVSGSVCNRQTQNSLQQMKRKLGLWPGGMKPDPFIDIVSGTLPGVPIYPGELQGSAYGCALGGTPLRPWSSVVVGCAALALLIRRRRGRARR